MNRNSVRTSAGALALEQRLAFKIVAVADTISRDAAVVYKKKFGLNKRGAEGARRTTGF